MTLNLVKIISFSLFLRMHFGSMKLSDTIRNNDCLFWLKQDVSKDLITSKLKADTDSLIGFFKDFLPNLNVPKGQEKKHSDIGEWVC